jgi:hypothetical protein
MKSVLAVTSAESLGKPNGSATLVLPFMVAPDAAPSIPATQLEGELVIATDLSADDGPGRAEVGGGDSGCYGSSRKRVLHDLYRVRDVLLGPAAAGVCAKIAAGPSESGTGTGAFDALTGMSAPRAEPAMLNEETAALTSSSFFMEELSAWDAKPPYMANHR